LARVWEGASASLRSLIGEVGTLPLMKNVVKKSFENYLLLIEWSVRFSALEFSCLFLYDIRRRQIVIFRVWKWYPIKKRQTRSESPKLLTSSSDSPFYRVSLHHKLQYKVSFLNRALTFGLTFLRISFEVNNASILYQMLSIVFWVLIYQNQKPDFESHNLIIWLCKLEHILAFFNCSFILCYYQNFIGIVQNSIRFNTK